MERHREKPKAAKPHPEEKQRRFRLVKLEERIAPRRGGNGTHNNCGVTAISCYCTYSIE
jgi:hypothetical protein